MSINMFIFLHSIRAYEICLKLMREGSCSENKSRSKNELLSYMIEISFLFRVATKHIRTKKKSRMCVENNKIY